MTPSRQVPAVRRATYLATHALRLAWTLTLSHHCITRLAPGREVIQQTVHWHGDALPIVQGGSDPLATIGDGGKSDT
jgi:hypothetical protein